MLTPLAALRQWVWTSALRAHVCIPTLWEPAPRTAGRYRHSYEWPAQVAGVQTAQDDHRWHGVHCWGEARSPKEHADSPVMGECRPGNSDTGSSASPDRQKPRYRGLRPQHPNLGSPGWRPGDDTPCRMMPMLSSRTYDLL